MWMALNEEGRMLRAEEVVPEGVDLPDDMVDLELPEGVDIMELDDWTWDGTDWHYDGWATHLREEQERRQAEQEATNLAWELVRSTVLDISAPSMTDDELLAVQAVVAEWEAGKTYRQGAVCQHEGELYRVAQAHTSQADWEPQDTPSLYTHVTIDPTTGVEEWTQPTGAHDAYALGAEVTHNGILWRSTVDDNVWEPGVYGWEAIG